MIYGTESIDLVVVVDPPRRRFKLLLAIPTVADATRAAYIVAIRKYVRFVFAKTGQADSGVFDPTASPDVNGWVVLP